MTLPRWTGSSSFRSPLAEASEGLTRFWNNAFGNPSPPESREDCTKERSWQDQFFLSLYNVQQSGPQLKHCWMQENNSKKGSNSKKVCVLPLCKPWGNLILIKMKPFWLLYCFSGCICICFHFFPLHMRACWRKVAFVAWSCSPCWKHYALGEVQRQMCPVGTKCEIQVKEEEQQAAMERALPWQARGHAILR